MEQSLHNSLTILILKNRSICNQFVMIADILPNALTMLSTRLYTGFVGNSRERQNGD